VPDYKFLVVVKSVFLSLFEVLGNSLFAEKTHPLKYQHPPREIHLVFLKYFE
jgi:hypothetical protein